MYVCRGCYFCSFCPLVVFAVFNPKCNHWNAFYLSCTRLLHFCIQIWKAFVWQSEMGNRTPKRLIFICLQLQDQILAILTPVLLFFSVCSQIQWQFVPFATFSWFFIVNRTITKSSAKLRQTPQQTPIPIPNLILRLNVTVTAGPVPRFSTAKTLR